MHSHNHDKKHHDHCHGNHKVTKSNKHKLGIILIMTTVYMVAEFIGGYLSNSLTLMADSGHMLSDVGALGLSFFALWLYLKPASPEKTYGYYRTEILAAFVNGLALVIISLLIMYDSYFRFFSHFIVKAPVMIIIGIGGVLVNSISVMLLHKSSKENLNIHGALLHIVGDLFGSVGAIIAGLAIILWKFYLADPIISFTISLLILYSAISLINEAVNVLLEASPSHINVELVRESIFELLGVEDVHDLHIWSISSTNIALSIHIVTKSKDYNQILCKVHEVLESKFNITHVTVQLEEPDFHEGKCSF